jgi:[citrate (pro-3S)-lyase] ligase
MELDYGYPYTGAARERLRAFLGSCGLKYDERVGFTVSVLEDGEIAASGSLDGAILKCIAVPASRAGKGLAAVIVSELVKEAARKGRYHLFLFTKPDNAELFSSLGFYQIVKTDAVLLMENKKDGVARFVAELSPLPSPPYKGGGEGKGDGAIVANCNPFTRGHLYLIETAAKQCETVRLFIVSEDRSRFSAGERYRLAAAGTAHIPNLLLHQTGPYLVSAMSFPDYFLKETVSPEAVNTELDLRIFAERFALPLGITRRYVGAEPSDPVTAAYNRQMAQVLPRYGIEVVELPRLEADGVPISASRVRRSIDEGDWPAVEALLPPAVYAALTRAPARRPAS